MILPQEFVAGSVGQCPFRYIFFCMKVILNNICTYCAVNPDPFFRPVLTTYFFLYHANYVFGLYLNVIDYNFINGLLFLFRIIKRSAHCQQLQ